MEISGCAWEKSANVIRGNLQQIARSPSTCLPIYIIPVLCHLDDGIDRATLENVRNRGEFREIRILRIEKEIRGICSFVPFSKKV